MAGWFFENADAATPEAFDRKRALINALSKENLSAAPVGHWTQALARVLGAAADGYQTAEMNSQEKKAIDENKAALMNAFGLGGGASPAAPSAGAALPASQPAPASAPVPRETGANPQLPTFAQNPNALSLIRSFEGYRDKPYWDVNANRIGYGSSTVTNADGSVQSVQPGMKITQQQAELDLNRRVNTEFMPRAQAAVGENWNKLTPAAQAALTSITYNYGSLPKSVVAAAQTGDPAKIAAAVEGLSSHNGGVNANRRAQEAALIRGGDMPAQGAQPAGITMQNGVPTIAQPAPSGMANPQTQALLAALSSPWAAKNPVLSQVGQSVLSQQLAGDKLQYQTDGDGNIIALDPTGRKAPSVVYRAAVKPVSVAEGAKLVNPVTGQEIAAGGDKGTPDQKNYEAAVKGGFKGTFGEYQIALRRAASAQPESTFDVEMAKGQAKNFNEMAGELPAAKSDIANVKMLREQLAKLPGGFMGNAQAMAVRMGIKVGDNASAVEAADAILARLTPAQRQGMPGAASDRDVQMFRAALPQLGQTKEGQKIILDTMEGMAQYKLKQAELAQQVSMGKIKPAQAMEQLAAIPDPFEQFRAIQGTAQQQQAPTGPKPGDVQQGYRYKGGNPADPKSWEKV